MAIALRAATPASGPRPAVVQLDHLHRHRAMNAEGITVSRIRRAAPWYSPKGYSANVPSA
jgi:hypothetical protein